MTNAELKAAIKNELTRHGFTKGYSISVRYAGYSSRVTIRVNSPHINRAEVERIACKFDEFERDASGDILAGGNTFVYAEYKDGIFDELAAEYVEDARHLMDSLNEVTSIAGGLFLIRDDGRYKLRDEREHATRCISTPEQLAEFLYKFYEFGTIAA